MPSLRLEYDRETDAVYVYLCEEIHAGGVARTISVDPQAIRGMVNLDLDDDGQVIGLEVLDASRMLRPELLAMADCQHPPGMRTFALSWPSGREGTRGRSTGKEKELGIVSARVASIRALRHARAHPSVSLRSRRSPA